MTYAKAINKVKGRLFYSKFIIFIFGILYLLGDVLSNIIGFNQIPLERLYLLFSFLATIIVLSIIPNIKIHRNKTNLKQMPLRVNITIPVIVVLIAYIFITHEILSNFIGFFNRIQRGNLYSTMEYVIIDIFIKSIIVYFLYYWNILTKRQKRIIALMFVFIVLFDIAMLGGRRTSVFIIITFIGSVFIDFSKYQKKIISIGILSIGVLFFLFGGIREIIVLNRDIKDFNVVKFTSNANEFETVTRSIDKYVNYANENGFTYGKTLIIWPLFFVPRSIWSNKVESISRETGIFPNFFGEAYLNFGIFAPLFIFLFFFIILILINNTNINSLIFFCLLPEIFRTSFSEYVFTLIMLSFFIVILSKIQLIKIKKTKAYTDQI